MTREEAVKILNDYDINFERNTADEIAEAHEMAVKALEAQPSENEQIIRIKKGTLKARTGRFVIYDVEWLKTHFNTTEAKIYGQSKAEGARGDIPLQQSAPKMPQPSERTEERTETHECDCISKTGHWEWVQYESKPNFGNWHCSECRHILCGAIKGNPVKLPNYCEECGSYNGGAKK